MLDRLTSFLKSVSKSSHDVGTIVFLPLMTFLVALNVIFRYALNKPLAWGEEINGLLLFLVLFLSLTYTWDQKRHIRMEIFYVHLKGPMRSIADLASGITGIIFFGLLGIQSVRDIPYMIKTHEAGEELGIPLWPFRSIMAIISFIFVLKLFIYIFRQRKEIETTEREIEGVKIKREKD
jgi:TRAP-type C4-dicarboxylate transport system permease small subunit